MTTASVELWGNRIGAVTWLAEQQIGVFQYTDAFAASGIQVAPLMMPLRTAPYQFPELPKATFLGLPGMLTDSLPDKFGNALINIWLAQQNRTPESFNPVERLCYTGTRGMGGLTFSPSIGQSTTSASKIEVERLVDLANRILNERIDLSGSLSGQDDIHALEEILRVGTSAGGARAKAVLAWNQSTGKFRSGQVNAGEGYTYWLMKFDGVEQTKQSEISETLGFGRIEYAYSLMAKAAGIVMMPCRLHEEGGRAHFMTKRYDRADEGEKLHYQSLGAMMHFDFNSAGTYSYEQVLLTIKRLQLPMIDLEQQMRRSIFNVIARNQDDHVKNIGFLMNRRGQWRLSPAFDVVYSYNPSGIWTSRHQLSMNGKRDNFEREDLIAFTRTGGMKRTKANELIDEIGTAVAKWKAYADEARVKPTHVKAVQSALRLKEFGFGSL